LKDINVFIYRPTEHTFTIGSNLQYPGFANNINRILKICHGREVKPLLIASRFKQMREKEAYILK
jgi:hypothetical protein